MLGNGMFTVSAVLFYTQVVGLSVIKVGLGVGLSTCIGMFSGAPIGRLADRRGPREIYLVTLVIQGAAMACLVLVTSFWSFVLLLTIGSLAQSGSVAARGPIVRQLAGPKPAHFRAYLRASVNLSASIGLLIATAAIQANTRTAYSLLILGNAATYVATAIIISRIPHLKPIGGKKSNGSKHNALRDRPFLAFTGLNAFVSLQSKAITYALPLWIVLHTHVPRWMIGTSVLVGTIMVILLQVRISKNVETNEKAARMWRKGGWALMIGMILIGSTGSISALIAALLILAGIAVMTLGEIWQAAGSFELRYSLAPRAAQGEYSGVFQMGTSIVGIFAPSLLGLLCVTWGAPGWWLLGGLFAATGVIIPGVVRWSEHSHRQDETADAESEAHSAEVPPQTSSADVLPETSADALPQTTLLTAAAQAETVAAHTEKDNAQ